jgi:type I restriction-modification system DNA methylase subunit
MSKKLGAIYTPDGHAQILTTWAIQSRTDVVLDMGVGPGIFVYQSYERLRKLGARKDKATDQIYGAEIDDQVFKEFTRAAKEKGLTFKNLQSANFFEITLPQLDAIVGNPPYVRRRGMKQDSLALIRSKTLQSNSSISEEDLSSLSDLYIYFLLSALPYLKPGGRLATIVADSWLNTRYGVALKKYLLSKFEINQIIGLDRSVFEDAQVKAVLLLASKKNEETKRNFSIKFARVRNGLPISQLSSFVLMGKVTSSEDIVVKRIKSSELNIKSPWGSILKSSTVYDEIRQNKFVKSISEIANCQIGLETLAKDFGSYVKDVRWSGKLQAWNFRSQNC